MGFKRVLGNIGLFAGRSFFGGAGIGNHGRFTFKLTDELKQEIAEIIAASVYAALEEFEERHEDEILAEPKDAYLVG